MRILLTGPAGFIGFATSLYLLRRGDEVISVYKVNGSTKVRKKYRDELCN